VNRESLASANGINHEADCLLGITVPNANPAETEGRVLPSITV
jgi:hypothetical protein